MVAVARMRRATWWSASRGLGQEAEEGVKDMGVHGKQFKIDGDALIAESVRPEQGPRLQAS